jgi:hypothetical protein
MYLFEDTSRTKTKVFIKRSISMSLRPTFIGSMFLVVSLVILSTGCEQPTTTNTATNNADSNSVSGSGTVKLDGQIISIPSPNQLAILVRQSNVPFKQEQLHDLKIITSANKRKH